VASAGRRRGDPGRPVALPRRKAKGVRHDRPWWVAALASWGLARFACLPPVSAYRRGDGARSLPQRKILQETITLTVFVPFVLLHMRQPWAWHYPGAALVLLGAIFSAFRG